MTLIMNYTIQIFVETVYFLKHRAVGQNYTHTLHLKNLSRNSKNSIARFFKSIGQMIILYMGHLIALSILSVLEQYSIWCLFCELSVLSSYVVKCISYEDLNCPPVSLHGLMEDGLLIPKHPSCP